MKQEFDYPFFNGYFANIKFGLGDKTYIGTQEEFSAYVSAFKIPTKGIPDTTGKSVVAND